MELLYISLLKIEQVSKTLCYGDDTVLPLNRKSWEEAFSKGEIVTFGVKFWLDHSLLTLTQKNH